jgi:hypothetical protein
MSERVKPQSKTEILASETGIICPFIHAAPAEKSMSHLFHMSIPSKEITWLLIDIHN